MSRIHEALKRAEQLRTVPMEVPPPVAPPPPPIVPEAGSHVADLPELPSIPPTQVVDPLAQTHIETKRKGGEFFRFDYIWTQCANPGWRLNLERNVFIDPAAPQAVREQFRTLRSRLYQIRDKQPLRSVLVTSSLPGEGKTFVAKNLAHALARQQNCRVLLIDADLRRADLHLGFGAPSSPGL